MAKIGQITVVFGKNNKQEEREGCVSGGPFSKVDQQSKMQAGIKEQVL